jgi:uncharacterized repeat protein (TIGR04076 family)
MNAEIKITVMKRLLHPDLVDLAGTGPWEPCERLAVGQEFVSRGANMPEGFCSWAWADVQKYVLTLARGGNFLGVKPGRFITCCTDGFRPVVFQLERIETEGG